MDGINAKKIFNPILLSYPFHLMSENVLNQEFKHKYTLFSMQKSYKSFKIAQHWGPQIPMFPAAGDFSVSHTPLRIFVCTFTLNLRCYAT